MSARSEGRRLAQRARDLLKVRGLKVGDFYTTGFHADRGLVRIWWASTGFVEVRFAYPNQGRDTFKARLLAGLDAAGLVPVADAQVTTDGVAGSWVPRG